MTNSINLAQSVSLPCGAVLPNRIAKAAMTEGLADYRGVPSQGLNRLYEAWSDGGAGLLITGNVQIDKDHLERPGNVIIDKQPDEEMKSALASWAKAGTRNGNHLWAQISHAGRQTQKAVNPQPKAPSAVKLGLPGGLFGEPVALQESEIKDIVQGFARCASALQQTGFTGVQIHGAHGYLISQFLSPRSNQRQDEYGGSLENRARLLLQVVAAVRAEVGSEFPISVKLNSADFQKGGFNFQDSFQVVQWLESASVDLIEISGGTYEQPKLLGATGVEETEEQNVAQSTMDREAYFVDFALEMQKKVSIPLMVTGGFRQSKVMQQAVEQGAADVIGIGRPMCVDTDAPQQLLNGEASLHRYEDELSLLPKALSFLGKLKLVNTMATFSVMFWYYAQFLSIAETGKVNRKLSVMAATMKLGKHEKTLLNQRKKNS